MTIEIIARPKQGGKTTELMRRMEEDTDLVLVSLTQAHAYHAFQAMAQKRREAGQAPLAIDRFVSLNQVLSRRLRGRSTTARYLVDNLDLVLPSLFGAEIEAVTITSEDIT